MATEVFDLFAVGQFATDQFALHRLTGSPSYPALENSGRRRRPAAISARSASASMAWMRSSSALLASMKGFRSVEFSGRACSKW